MSLYARIAAALLAALVVAGLWWKLDLALSKADATGYARRAAEDKAAADKQAAANRDLQRAAELKYVVKRDAQEKFLVTTVREIRDAAAPLATCPVPRDVVRLLNAASHCASSDDPASCGADGAVPKAR